MTDSIAQANRFRVTDEPHLFLTPFAGLYVTALLGSVVVLSVVPSYLMPQPWRMLGS